MQRVSALLPSWDGGSSFAQNTPRRPSSSTAPHQQRQRITGQHLSKVFSWTGRQRHRSATASSSSLSIGPRKNSLVTTSAEKEAFWPLSLAQECDKAARILKSFCSEGFLTPADDDDVPSDASQSPPLHTVKKIPTKVVQNAVALAVFTCMRSGLWVTGSGGSGILIARKADGTWSPPSGIMLHTPRLSFVIGVDVYDCVLVINDFSVLETFAQPSMTLGADISIGPGPLAVKDPRPHSMIQWSKFDNSVFSYLKSRGRGANIQLDGSVLTERANENEAFYQAPVSVMDILSGSVGREIPELGPLTEMLKAAEGRTDFNPQVISQLSSRTSPGDMDITTARHESLSPVRSSFGIPSVEDPDPFGMLALEMAGLEIRKAGSKTRPISSQFDLANAVTPSSPLFANFQQTRSSIDTAGSRSNRGSIVSSRTTGTMMTDAGTQTDSLPSPTRAFASGGDELYEKPIVRVQTVAVKDHDEKESHVIVQPVRVPLRMTTRARQLDSVDEEQLPTPATLESTSTCVEETGPSSYPSDDDSDEFEEPVVYQVATAAAASPLPITAAVQKTAKAVQLKGPALVNIPKRSAPPLPGRSPARLERGSKGSFGEDMSSVGSPLRQVFTEELHSPSPREESPPISAPVSENGVSSSTPDVAATTASTPSTKWLTTVNFDGSQNSSTTTAVARSDSVSPRTLTFSHDDDNKECSQPNHDLTAFRLDDTPTSEKPHSSGFYTGNISNDDDASSSIYTESVYKAHDDVSPCSSPKKRSSSPRKQPPPPTSAPARDTNVRDVNAVAFKLNALRYSQDVSHGVVATPNVDDDIYDDDTFVTPATAFATAVSVMAPGGDGYFAGTVVPTQYKQQHQQHPNSSVTMAS